MDPQPNSAQPQLKPQQAAQSMSAGAGLGPEKKPRPLAKLGLMIGAVILAAAVGVGVFLNNPGSASDEPSPAQIAEMESSWAAAQQIGVSLPLVAPEEQAEALASLNLPEDQEAALVAEVEAERVSLVWITLWDNMAQDGDIVSVYSDGVNLSVPILNAPTRIALPRPAGSVVNLTGVKDGGGGITLGLMSGPDQVLIPPLAPGQVVGIPVR